MSRGDGDVRLGGGAQAAVTRGLERRQGRRAGPRQQVHREWVVRRLGSPWSREPRRGRGDGIVAARVGYFLGEGVYRASGGSGTEQLGVEKSHAESGSAVRLFALEHGWSPLFASQLCSYTLANTQKWVE